MRIAQVATLSAPVHANTHGSVEALIWLMAREMTRLGHEVTTFATAGSEVPGRLITTLPGPYGAPGGINDWQLCEWMNLSRAVALSREFDVVHTHAYLWGMPLQPMSHAPLVHTMHIVPDDDHAQLWRMTGPACVTAISQHQWSAFPDLKPAAVIPHGLDVSRFTFAPAADDYVCYLGRFTSGKGPRQAILAAREAGVKIILAGPENPYFHEHVKPLIDGSTAEFVGPVNPAERNRLLSRARALVYPIQYPETFGLVLVEAMLCGTPVAAMRLGAVPEIIEDGVNGVTADRQEDMAAAIQQCFPLDRARVRQIAEQRFSADRMARDYIAVYERVHRQR